MSTTTSTPTAHPVHLGAGTNRGRAVVWSVAALAAVAGMIGGGTATASTGDEAPATTAHISTR